MVMPGSFLDPASDDSDRFADEGKPSPVRQVLIPKKQPGKFRPLGIPCLRDWVAQTLARTSSYLADKWGYRPVNSLL